MPKLQNQVPKMCNDRGRAYSKHNGKRIYHGVWGSDDAKKSYKRFIAALLENPSLPVVRNEGDVLVSELCDAFLRYYESRMKDKTEYKHHQRAIGFLCELYGDVAVDEFSPKKLKTVRVHVVKSETHCREQINKMIKRIVRIFKWGVGEELVRGATWQDLKAVPALRKGEEETFDHPPRQPVPLEVVARTLLFLPPTVAAMVQLQYQTGMRPSEIFEMTVGSIDRSRGNGLWYYVLDTHKTEEYIGIKEIPLNEEEQALIAPYLVGKKPEAAVFSPRTAMTERNAKRSANRKTKPSPSHLRKAEERAKKPSCYAEFYNRDSYRRAIEHAIRKGNRAGVEIPHWFPYQLRHACAGLTH